MNARMTIALPCIGLLIGARLKQVHCTFFQYCGYYWILIFTPSIAAVLLKSGADFNLRDKKGDPQLFSLFRLKIVSFPLFKAKLPYRMRCSRINWQLQVINNLLFRIIVVIIHFLLRNSSRSRGI